MMFQQCLLIQQPSCQLPHSIYWGEGAQKSSAADLGVGLSTAGYTSNRRLRDQDSQFRD